MPPRSDRRPRLRMDPDERRRLILDVARREFAARPYEEVSLSAIARAARASEALVHKYFSTKGRLYGQILSLDAADLAERTRLAAETLTDDATVRDHVRTSVGVYLDFIAERAPGWAEYQMLAGYEPSEAAEVRRRAREASVEALRRLLARTGGADRATGPDGSGGRDGVDSGSRGNGRGRNSGSAAKSGKKPAKKKSGAKAVSDALAAQFAEEEAELRRSLGVEEGGRVPPAVSAQITALREDQKRRATRAQRDRLDRALVDLLSLYRDVLTVQLGADVALVNRDFADRIAEVAASTSAEQSIRRMDAISQARTRLAGNVAPLLALEAMMVSLRPQG